jgi:hypothetical protein
MGAIRDARRAGASDDTTVTPVPTRNDTMIVRGRICNAPVGRSIPNAPISASSGFTIAMPRMMPSTDESAPTVNDSTITDVVTCRPLAPSARRSPSSRIRCAIVMEKVL